MKTHLQLAQLSKAVYTTPPDGEAAEIEYIHVDGVHALRGTSKDRGEMGWTGLISDLQTDRKILPRNDSQIGRHPRGFCDAAKAMYQTIRHYPEPFILTGHSLGGAVAILTAAYLAANGADVHQVITFGCPRIGRLLIRGLGSVVMYKYRSDGVTMVPWGWSQPVPVWQVGKPRWHPSLRDHAIDNYIGALASGG